MFDIASAGPQSVAPFLGATLFAVGDAGQDCTLLHLTAAALTPIGALATLPVTKVK